jgi:hypothetical protein
MGRDRVIGMIRRGQIRAVNTSESECGKPRYVIPPEAVEEFERSFSAAEPPKPTRRKKPITQVDFFPNL